VRCVPVTTAFFIVSATERMLPSAAARDAQAVARSRRARARGAPPRACIAQENAATHSKRVQLRGLGGVTENAEGRALRKASYDTRELAVVVR